MVSTAKGDHATIDEVAACALAASQVWGATAPAERSVVLAGLARALRDTRDELVTIASEETGLSQERLNGELERTAVQLELFATVAREGRFLDVRIDERDEQYVLGVRPELRRFNIPVGPVLMFAAGNFPFAFSTLGGDTASALAAGCAVIVKGHSGHPALAARAIEIARTVLADAGAPRDVLQLIVGQENGVAMLRHPAIAAASFTGSERVGTLLADIAASREHPIPFYGELGSVNPVFVTPGAASERAAAIVSGYLASVGGSAGQLCTKPGFLFVPANSGIAERIAEIGIDARPHRMLTPAITEAFGARRATILASDVRVLREGEFEVDEGGAGWAIPTIVATTARELERLGPALAEEAFGPLSIVVEYETGDDLIRIADVAFAGNLTGTLHTGDHEDEETTRELVHWLTEHSGRVVFNGWPTGVAVTPAMQHGGPWPASTNAATTSVGTAAIDRFTRPVTFQDAPEVALPPALRDSNPWGIPQSRDAAGTSKTWGSGPAMD